MLKRLLQLDGYNSRLGVYVGYLEMIDLTLFSTRVSILLKDRIS